MIRSASDIQRIALDLRSRYTVRNTRYSNNYYAYRGEYQKIGPGYSADPLADVRREPGGNFQVWNLVLPIVDTHRMLLNRLPQIQVPAPVMANPQAADKAEKQERMLYALWDANKMTKKHGEACFNLALYNNTIWFVKWDQEMDLPAITVRQPGECYPMPKRNGDELAYCIFYWQQYAEDVYENFPDARSMLSRADAAGRRNDMIDVYEYIDNENYVLVVGNKTKAVEVAGAGMGKLGFCPVVVNPSSFVPGDLFPPGAVDQMVALNDYLNRFQTKWGDALESVMFPGVVLQGEGSDQIVWETGPLAVNKLPEGVEYKPVNPPQLPQEVFVHLERIEQLMRRISQFPESASGEVQGSIVTGKAISRLQGVMTGMAAESQANLGLALTDVNRMAMAMLENYRPSKKYTLHSKAPVVGISAPGRNNGKSSFAVEIIPEQDIAGYYESQLFYSPFGTDWNQSLVTGMQMVQSRVASHRWLMNQLPGISDAEGMAKEIEEEDERRMRMEVKLQTESQAAIAEAQAQAQAQAQIQVAQAAGGGSPEGAGAGTAPAAQSGGGSPGGLGPAANTVAMPSGRPQAMGTGAPLTGEEGFPLEFVDVKPYQQGMQSIEKMQGGQGEALPGKTLIKAEDIIAAITASTNRKGEQATAKLKGRVWLIGQIAQRGWTDGNIEIAIEVKSDQQIIVSALPEYAAQNKLKFTVIEAGQEPPQPNRPVNGGA